jgi:hydrogenase-4 component E
LHAQVPVGESLNTLSAGLILICAFAIVGTRQVQGVRRFFIAQSTLLAASCFLLAWDQHIRDLWWLGAITLGAKVIVIPRILKRALAPELYIRRELSQTINIPSSLLLALLLAIGSELLVGPLASATGNQVIEVNLPIGLASLLIAAYSLAARREAIPQLLGILAMENGAFLAGIAIAPTLPLIAELAIAIDVVLIAVIVGLLTRTIENTMGTTEAAALSELKEETIEWR